MCLFSHTCCHMHVCSLVKVLLARMQGECAIRVYLVDWDSFQQTCCYTWPFSCPLIVHPISSLSIPSSPHSLRLIFFTCIWAFSAVLSWGRGEQTDQRTYPDRFHRQAVNLSSLPPPCSLSLAHRHADTAGYVGRSVICETDGSASDYM